MKNKITKQQFQAIKKFSEMNYADDLHSTEHVRLAVGFARLIAKAENADIDVCVAAAMLHDIAKKGKNHESEGAKIARKFLKKIKVDENVANHICRAIEFHSSSTVHKIRTLEGRIVFDADKLQMIGPYGFYRVLYDLIVYKKMEMNKALKEAHRLMESRYNLLQTKTAKKIAKEPHELMEKFYELYDKCERVDFA